MSGKVFCCLFKEHLKYDWNAWSELEYDVLDIPLIKGGFLVLFDALFSRNCWRNLLAWRVEIAGTPQVGYANSPVNIKRQKCWVFTDTYTLALMK